MHYDCLIVDDEESIANSTCEYFNLFGVRCACAYGYQECLDFLRGNDIGVLLLDVGLGDGSGFALCKELREKSSVPILFISARTSDDDILTALHIGGDDYIKKPFTLTVLLAKVQAVLRRYGGENAPKLLRAGTVEVDCAARRVTVGGETVRLKEMEYKLLVCLLENKNRVVSKAELLEKVWPDAFVGEGTLAVHVRRLREKLERDPNAPELIKTVWGTGYILEDLS